MSFRGFLAIVACVALTACAAPKPRGPVATAPVPSKPAAPATAPPWGEAPAPSGKGGIYKVGNPYVINGVTYVPREDPTYSETGIASWYGPQFNGERTANGEIFDMHLVSAAHRTLPMPSLVRVTNLENGRSMVVRLNDRGPYARGRIIDMSKKAAELLGFQGAGTAMVRVEYVGRAPLENGAPVAVAVKQEAPKQLAAEPKGIYVQAGAFGNPDNANRLKGRLQAIGPTRVHTALVNGANFYRVRIGPYANVEDADLALAQVIGLGEVNALIVVDR
ncbi:septal ring lytic transglycosylase RlpA family protein [Emcibacter sp. SYSU 3D8]|uniref:septal ring lytic transglycosylase RlpA family protein n=1 Tax=Emcibacter sp. SYSU 3D8 TaxID=3133969 RepID=UPI0031FE80B4